MALTTASGIVNAVRARMQEFRARDLATHRAITFGKPFTSSRMKVTKNMYKGADAQIPLNAMASTPNAPSWLKSSRPEDRVDLRERDIIHWEGQARAALRILSLIELINQTQRRAANRLSSAEMEDLLATNVKAIKDLVKINTEWLTNCIQVRRDNILQRCPLTADQLFELRHAPIVEEKFLFPDELVREVHNKHLQEVQNEALRARYAAPSRANYGGGGAFNRDRQEHRGRGAQRGRNAYYNNQPGQKQPQKGQQPGNRVFTQATQPNKHR